jgi:hypothetical protein
MLDPDRDSLNPDTQLCIFYIIFGGQVEALRTSYLSTHPFYNHSRISRSSFPLPGCWLSRSHVKFEIEDDTVLHSGQKS